MRDDDDHLVDVYRRRIAARAQRDREVRALERGRRERLSVAACCLGVGLAFAFASCVVALEWLFR